MPKFCKYALVCIVLTIIDCIYGGSYNMKIPKIDNINLNEKFNVLFENYILSNKPFKSRIDSKLLKNNDVEDIIIPRVVKDNYLFKLNTTIVNNYTSDYIDLIQQWPSQIEINKLFHSCPLVLNNLIYHSNPNITLKVTITRHNDKIININDLDQSSIQLNTDLKYKEIELSYGEYLYLPNGYLYQIESNDVNNSSIYLICSLDPSNLNNFREIFYNNNTLYNNIYYNNILNELNNINKIITNEPVDTLYSNISNLVESDIKDDNQNITKVIEDRLNRRNRKNNKNSWKDWNDINKWNNLIISLTIDRPYGLFINNTNRNNITLYWKSNYLPDISDQTTFGFNISIYYNGDIISYRVAYKTYDKSIAANNNMLYSITDNNNPDIIFYTVINNLLPNSTYHFTIKSFYDTKYFSPKSNIVTVTTIPITSPVYQPSNIDIFEDNNNNSYIKFNKLFDDGGSNILGYHLYLQIIDNYVNNQLNFHMTYYSNSSYIKSYDDNYIYLQLHNLIPNIKYIFYIQIFNSIGNTTMSLSSNEYIYYSNDGMIISYDIIALSNWKIYYYYISLSDREQTIDVVTVRENNKQIATYEVWTCFWSPKSFTVESQITWTAPKLLNDPNILNSIEFLNTNDLRNKIVFTYRGALPLIIKVLAIQKAGAIGIVIVDNNDNSDHLCQSYDQSCLPGATKALGEGFGKLDKPKLWSNVKIPVVFILNSLADEIATYIDNIKIDNISNTDDKLIHHDEL